MWGRGSSGPPKPYSDADGLRPVRDFAVGQACGSVRVTSSRGPMGCVLPGTFALCLERISSDQLCSVELSGMMEMPVNWCCPISSHQREVGTSPLKYVSRDRGIHFFFFNSNEFSLKQPHVASVLNGTARDCLVAAGPFAARGSQLSKPSSEKLPLRTAACGRQNGHPEMPTISTPGPCGCVALHGKRERRLRASGCSQLALTGKVALRLLRGPSSVLGSVRESACSGSQGWSQMTRMKWGRFERREEINPRGSLRRRRKGPQATHRGWPLGGRDSPALGRQPSCRWRPLSYDCSGGLGSANILREEPAEARAQRCGAPRGAGEQGGGGVGQNSNLAKQVSLRADESTWRNRMYFH